MYRLPEMHRLSQPPSLASVSNQVGVATQHAKQGAKSKNTSWNSSSLQSSPSANEENNVLTAKQSLLPSTSSRAGKTHCCHAPLQCTTQLGKMAFSLPAAPLNSQTVLAHSKNVVVTRGLLFSFHESTVEMYGDTLREFLCSLEHCIYGSQGLVASCSYIFEVNINRICSIFLSSINY